MSEWKLASLGAVAQVVGGGTPSTREPAYWGGEVAWLTPSELTRREGQVISATERRITTAGLANSSAKMLPEGAVLLTSRATIGAVGLAGRPMATNQGFQSLICDESVLPGFLMRWVQANKDEFTSRAGGSTFPEISGKKIKSIPISLPPIAEQRRIVDVVSGVDAHVEAVAEEAEQARCLYTATTSRLWLDTSGEEALPRALADIMRLDIERQVLDPSRSYRAAGVLNAGQGLIDKGELRGDATQYAGMNVLRAQQLVMRKLTAWEGPITVVPTEFDGFVASNEFPTFTLSDEVSPAWMRHVCRTRRLWEEMKNRVTGTVQRRKRLNPHQLLAVALPVPPRDAQERSAAALDSIDVEITALCRELADLRSFRTALLSALLSHEIEIPESYDALLEKVS